VNRPYRDDEEKQRDKYLTLLEDISYAVQNGDLEQASELFVEADQLLDHLCEMVKQFDLDEALEAVDGRY